MRWPYLSAAILTLSLLYLGCSTAEQEKEFEEEEEETGADKQLMMWFQSKGYPEPQDLSGKYQRAWEQYQEIKSRTDKYVSRTEVASWVSMGQSFNGGARIGGRVVCLAIDPANSSRLWAGSASGGIWKSTDAGNTWAPVVTNLPVLGVSSIIVDPSNSNVIYAGTGEVYRVDTSNTGFNVWKTRGTYGIGIIKSTDGGLTWSQVFTKTMSQLFAIQKLLFDPANSNTVYACATDGLYRSTDSGGTWTRIFNAIYVKDMVINPSNSNEVVISVGNMVNTGKGIYKSVNATNASPVFTLSSGLPASFDGSIRLDNGSSTTTIYASVGISSSTAATNREIYRSLDFGSTWTVFGGTTAGTTTNHCSYQFWFAHTVAANPFSTDSIWFGGVSICRYRVSTLARTSISGVHADCHDIVFDPNNRGCVYICCDGGVYKTVNGGASFTAMNTGLNATQFYASLGISRQDPDRIAGGLQDNGQVLYNGTQWNQVNWAGGDGTACAIDPNNDDTILVSRDAKQVYQSVDGGSSGGAVTNYWGFDADSRTAFVAPLAFSRSNSSVVYLASDNLHKSTNRGISFTNDPVATNAGTATNYIEAMHKTAIAMAISPYNANKLYISTSPFAQFDNDDNHLHITGQPNILRTTTGGTPFTSIKGSLPDRFVMDMAISPANDDSVFIALGGFGTSHIYVTGNGGASWTARGAGLPDVPFNALVFDPVNPQVIYAGCDLGVYVSNDRGLTWADFNTGFWDATLVMDLQISADNKLIAATHGKGVFKSNLYNNNSLPSRLLDFAGANRGQYNELYWVVSEEQNVSRYEVERSPDGIHYQLAGAKQSVNSMVPVTYTYNDPVGPAAAEYYYRLKTVDIDGRFTYSSVIYIRKVLKAKISVLNNPFQEMIGLRCNLPRDQRLIIQLFSATGALLREQTYHATSGTGMYSMYGFEFYPPGAYFLKVQAGDHTETISLIKN
ncbi:MAG: hypothetical protein U0U70_03385 [Chitinophagaceae bacterium]